MTTVVNDDINEENEVKQKGPLENLVGVNHTNDSQNSNNNSKSRDVANKTHSVVAYKYSNNKRGPLYKSVILAGHPMFIKYENGQVQAVEQIEEDSRIIRPPGREEYPYPAYGFAGYCLKMIISNKPLNPNKAKGLVERTLPFIVNLLLEIVCIQ